MTLISWIFKSLHYLQLTTEVIDRCLETPIYDFFFFGDFSTSSQFLKIYVTSDSSHYLKSENDYFNVLTTTRSL